MIKHAKMIVLVSVALGLVPQATLSARAQSTAPQVIFAYFAGKRLVVQGLNFQAGAVVLINGQAEPTVADTTNPGTVLIIKKGKKKLAALSHVVVQVENPDGTLSAEFVMDHLRTVTLADNGQTINLGMGDHLFVYLGTLYNWSFPPDQPYNTNVIAPVPGVGTLIIGAQALLETVNPGQTTLTLDGDPICRNSTPPCEIPSIRFQITVIVH
ncbi:MAG: hypothetical protein ACREDR_19720 [Blastocatellia bacterium]